MINTVKPLTLGNHSTQKNVECQYKSSHEKHDRERLLAVSMAYEKNSLKLISSTLKPRESFKREILSRLESLSIPIERYVHIWVEDEHRYGLMKVIRRCWTLKGHRPDVSHNDRYEWGYIYGALDIVTGKTEFIYSPTVSLEWSKEFLKQLVSTDPEAIHIILWDNAGYHPEILEGELSESVRFVPFPAYSPDFNPIEPLWNIVKQEIGNIL
jgi:hypothetical protein